MQLMFPLNGLSRTRDHSECLISTEKEGHFFIQKIESLELSTLEGRGSSIAENEILIERCFTCKGRHGM